MGVHTVFQGGFLVLLHGVGRHGDDGQGLHVLPAQRPDRAGRFVAVHHRHLHIHQDGVVIALLRPAHHVHRVGAVRGGFHLEASLLQDHLGNLPVQLVVLHQQDPLPAKIRLGPGGGLLLLDEVVGRQKDGFQVGHEQGLGAEGGDARPFGFLLDVRPVVGGEDDDGRVLSDGFPNAAAGFNAAELRHLPVDDVGVVGVPLVVGALGPVDRFPAGGGPLCPQPDLVEHPDHALAAVAVVIHHKGPQPLQLLDLGGVLLHILEL